jgi:hypothetical protein
VISDANATIKARHDYLPFGEEVAAGVGASTATQGYVADNLRQKFIPKERGVVTGLDHFEARYYSNVEGKFIPGPNDPNAHHVIYYRRGEPRR